MTTFADFYALYPRHIARKDAEKAWRQVIKEGIQPATILDGLRRQLPVMAAKDKQFLPYPATWLRGWRWEDEVEMPSRPALAYRQSARSANAEMNSMLFAEEPAYGHQIEHDAYLLDFTGSRH